MSWLGRAVRSLENPSLSLNDPEAWEEAGLLARSLSGAKVTPKRAIGLPPLWRGINLIANACRKLRPYVYEKDESGAKRDTLHPAHKLLRRKINNNIKAGVFRQTLTYHAVLFGNGYSAIFRDRLERPTEMLPLSPFDTFPFQAEGQVWYRTVIGGQQLKIPAKDVLHIHGLSFDGMKGLSVIEIMADTLGLAMSSRDYACRFFSQGMNASGILMIPGHLKEDAMRQVLKDFDKIATGVTKQHKVGLLQDDVKFISTTKSAQESQLMESRRFDAVECANTLGLPPHKLGDGSRTSYNSLEMESQAYLDDSIDPWLVTWEEELEEKLLTEAEKDNESRYIEFNRLGLLRTDQASRYRNYASARQWGLLSVNEIRKKENEPTIGPKGDVYLQPSNMVPAGTEPKPKQAPKPADPPVEPPKDPNAERMAAAIAASWDAIKDRAERFHKIEVDQVLAAAKRGGNFIGWLDTWWEQQRGRIVEGLTPEYRILNSLHGSNLYPAMCEINVAEYVNSRRSQLVEIAGRAKAAELAAAVETLVRGWTPDSLFERLKGE